MTPEQEAQLIKDRIRELRFELKRSPTQEEIQESIRQKPINFKTKGVTDLTDITTNPNRTVPVVGYREDPGDVSKYEPIQDDLTDEIMMLAQEVDAGDSNGLVQALNATKADDPKPTFAKDAEDLANQGSEVMKFNYLEGPVPYYYPITPLEQNVETSGSLTFDETNTLTQETPQQKRARINETRKTVLSEPGLVEKPEVVKAPSPISPISDMSTISENVDLLSQEGIPFEDVSETKKEIKRKGIVEVIAENVADVLIPESQKEPVPQDEDPQEVVQETIEQNQKIAKEQVKKAEDGEEVVTTGEGLVMPESRVLTSTTETVDPQEGVVETETIVEGAPAKSLTKTTLSKPPPQTQMVGWNELAKFLAAGDLNEEIVNKILDSPGYDMMFDKGIEKEKVDRINEEIKANNKRLDDVAKKKIKPFFGEKDTGRKFLAAIAAGMGAYASAMTGTKNFALEIINQAIETDLLKQKEQLERERLSILDQNKILQSRKAELYTVAQIQIKDAMAKAQSKADSAKLAVTLEGIQQKQREAKADLGVEILKASTLTTQSQSNRYVPGFGTTQFTDETLVRNAVKEAQKFGQNETTIIEHSNGIRDVLKTTKGKTMAAIWYTPERQRLQYHLAEIANLYRQKILELGTQFTTFEGPFLEAIIKKDFNWRELAVGRVGRMVDNLEKGMNAKKKGIMKYHKFTPDNTDSLQESPPLDLTPGLQKVSTKDGPK